jgi:hypothetical protein
MNASRNAAAVLYMQLLSQQYVAPAAAWQAIRNHAAANKQAEPVPKAKEWQA